MKIGTEGRDFRLRNRCRSLGMFKSHSLSERRCLQSAGPRNGEGDSSAAYQYHSKREGYTKDGSVACQTDRTRKDRKPKGGVIGSSSKDTVVTSKSFPLAGEMVLGEPFETVPGGKDGGVEL